MVKVMVGSMIVATALAAKANKISNHSWYMYLASLLSLNCNFYYILASVFVHSNQIEFFLYQSKVLLSYIWYSIHEMRMESNVFE